MVRRRSLGAFHAAGSDRDVQAMAWVAAERRARYPSGPALSDGRDSEGVAVLATRGPGARPAPEPGRRARGWGAIPPGRRCGGAAWGAAQSRRSPAGAVEAVRAMPSRRRSGSLASGGGGSNRAGT